MRKQGFACAAMSSNSQGVPGEPSSQVNIDKDDKSEPEADPKLARQIAGALAAINSNNVQKVGNTLVLPSGCTWPGTNNNILYVRECYAPIFDHVLDRCRHHRYWTDHRYIVTGQPGIAKSDLGSYIMYRLLTEQDRPNLHIIYMCEDIRARGLAAVIHKTPEGSRVSVRTLFGATPAEDDKAVMICDKVLPLGLHCAVVWISSPAALLVEHSKEERKKAMTGRVHLPLPTVGELLDMNNSTFRSMGLTEEDVRVRAALWGPVPRRVFSKDLVYLENLILSVKSMPLPQVLAVFNCMSRSSSCGINPNHVVLLERAAGQDEGSDADRLSRMQSPFYYFRGRTVVASEAFSSWVLSTIQRIQGLREFDRMSITIGLAERCSKNAGLFSQLALRVLETGGTFSVGSLSSRAVETWKLPRLQPAPGNNLQEPSSDSDGAPPATRPPAGLDGYNFCFYTPTRFSSGGGPKIDAEEVAESRGLLAGKGSRASEAGWKMSPVLQGANATSGSGTIHVCVLPEDRFDAWRQGKRPRSKAQRGGRALHVLRMPTTKLYAVVEAATGEKLLLAALDEVRRSYLRAAESRGAVQGGASSTPGDGGP